MQRNHLEILKIADSYSVNLKQGIELSVFHQAYRHMCDAASLSTKSSVYLALTKCYNVLIPFPGMYPVYSSACISHECGNLFSKVSLMMIRYLISVL